MLEQDLNPDPWRSSAGASVPSTYRAAVSSEQLRRAQRSARGDVRQLSAEAGLHPSLTANSWGSDVSYLMSLGPGSFWWQMGIIVVPTGRCEKKRANQKL